MILDLLKINKAEAHVLYIASEEDAANYGGVDVNILTQPFSNHFYLGLILLFLLTVSVIFLIVSKSKVIKNWAHVISHRAISYYELVPWMMRLSLGIALVGAGVSGFLVSPVLQNFQMMSFLQILTGFLLLSGFMTTIASLLCVIIFLLALSQNFYLLGSMDFLAMSFALIILDSRKPGLDDIFKIPDIKLTHIKQYVPVILRMGIGSSLIFLSIYEKFLNPNLSSYVVKITNLTEVINVSTSMWVVSTGLIELALGLLLFFGVATRFVSALTFFVLSMSFFYFGESVVSHITLFGILSVLFVLGGKKLKHVKD